MDKKSLTFLQKLVDTPSPSGFEQEAAALWREEACKFAHRVWADSHGNSFAVINESKQPLVMMAGHIDEIGLMITYIDDKGFLFFATIGGHDPQILPGQRVQVCTKKGNLLGVVGRKAVHLMKEEERKTVVKIENLWIDIGVKDKKEAESLVDVGDCVVLDAKFAVLKKHLYVARGFDDRVGAFVVLDALKKLSKMNAKSAVIAVATVQEEIGLRGAKTSAYGLNPLVGIAVDVTHVTDTPGMDEEKKKIGEAALGNGPVIARGANINPQLFSLFKATAEENKIPYQIEPAPGGTGTDANAIQLTRAGVAAALISVPNRYMHSPCEIVHGKDLESCASLIAHTVCRIDAKTDLIPR